MKVVALDATTRDFFLRRGRGSWTRTMMMFPGEIDSVLDVGAFVGDETVFSRMAHPRARIVALEPGAEAYEMLVRNVAGLDVVTRRMALGDGSVGRMGQEGASVSNSFRSDSSGDCRSARLDAIVSEFGLSGRMIVKMNCEGGERSVFDHAPSLEVLKASSIVLVECHGLKTIKAFVDLAPMFSGTHSVHQLGAAPRRRRLAFRMVSRSMPFVPEKDVLPLDVDALMPHLRRG
jgi:FkbM family methyltransferase